MSDKSGEKKDIIRGTQDDMEILGIIVNENPILKKKVLEKIRQFRDAAGVNPLDAIAERQKREMSNKIRK
jgi:hypothetical protein